MWYLLIFSLLLFNFYYSSAQGFEVGNNSEMHQHMSKEASEVLSFIPDEIKKNTSNPIAGSFDGTSPDYDLGNDLIDGSAEEDRTDPFPRFFNHFWQPDNPLAGSHIGTYDDGLWGFGSSYDKAKGLFRLQAVENYLQGNISEAYYYLGRTAHLLEDAAQPGHVHLDPHPDKPVLRWDFLFGYSRLERYTGNRTLFLAQWDGNSYSNQHYLYERLIPAPFDWDPVLPTNNKAFPDFFKLFWYTAQKTQYFASDDVEQDFTYTEVGGTQRMWSCSGTGYLNLWRDQFTNCGDFTTSSELRMPGGVEEEANAVVPHGMKAVAGLYRLFWDTVHGFDWPTHNQNNRRNGVIKAVKGDLTSPSEIRLHDLSVTSGVPADHFARPAIADLDGDGFREIVMTTSNIPRREGKLLAIEQDNTHQSYQRWIIDLGDVATVPPSLANLDADPQLEIIFGMQGGRIMRVDVDANGLNPSMQQIYRVPQKYSAHYGMSVHGAVGYTAVTDLDHDGNMEIVFTDANEDDDNWQGTLYVIDANGNLIDSDNLNDISGGAGSAPAIANLDSDDNLEIVVPGFYKLYAYNYDNQNLQEWWSNTISKASGAAVVEDVDFDGEYEIVVNTNKINCHVTRFCYFRTFFFSAGGNREWRESHSFEPSATPILLNLDNDPLLEAVFATYDDPYTSYGDMRAFDLASQNTLWTFDDGGALRPTGISPGAADIDNDGEMNIVWPTNLNQKVYVLNTDGSKLYDYTFGGLIGSSAALGDVDNDDMLEISLKREGSTLVTVMDNLNGVPELTITNNATIFENQLSDGAIELGILTNDPEMNPVSVHVGAPFNRSNEWIPDCHAEGSYEVVVEASDGNLSAWDIGYVQVLDTCDEEIEVSNISVMNTPGSLNVSFSVDVRNNLIIPIEEVVVFMDFGDGTNTTCAINQTLTPGTTQYCQVSHLYAMPGNKQVTVFAGNGFYNAEGNESFSLTQSVPPTGICGDCDNNAFVNINDALISAQVSSGTAVLLPGVQPQCDVNNDGGISILDALKIARYVVGLEPQLTC